MKSMNRPMLNALKRHGLKQELEIRTAIRQQRERQDTLSKAVKVGDIESVHTALRNGSTPFGLDNDDCSPLGWALEAENYEIAHVLGWEG